MSWMTESLYRIAEWRIYIFGQEFPIRTQDSPFEPGISPLESETFYFILWISTLSEDFPFG